MLRIFTICFVLFFGIVQARQVSPEMARQYATHFINQQGRRTATLDIDPVYTSKSTATKDQAPNFYYVFNLVDSKGFIIISADDQAIPILAYSFESNFEPNKIPDHIAKWLVSYTNQMRYIIDNNLPQTEEIKAAWEKLKQGQTVSVASKTMAGPLMSTTWDQSPNYNALCPYDNSYGERAVTGCVATAMTQIMKYYNYPSKGTGNHSYNHPKYGTLSANFGATTYNWSSMPNNVSSSNSAVATLMYHVGVSVDMNYNVANEGGSGAYVIASGSPTQNCSEYALKTYFGYKSSLSGKSRSAYSETSWVNLMKTEINASRPVLYAGYGSGGGHCFVLDGYDNNNYFHFNWGWGGYYDGYFGINALNPGGVGTGGGTGGFNSNHQAVIGIEPGTQGSSPQVALGLYAAITPSANPINYGDGFSITTNVKNTSNTNFSGDLGAFVYDASNNYVGSIQTKTGLSLSAGYVYSSNLTFTTTGISAMMPGTYTIGVYYKTTGGSWVACDNYNGNTNFVSITVKNNNSNPNGTIELYSNIVATPNPITKGASISVNADIVNRTATTFNGSYSMDLHESDGTWIRVIEQKDGNSLSPNYHYTNGLTFSGTITEAPGTYYIAMWYKPDGGSWTLVEEAGSYKNPIELIITEPGLSPDMYESNNTASTAYTFPLSFSGNQASFKTIGSNLHIGSDYDYYKVNLPSGYYYTVNARIHDSYNSGNGNTYTVDAQYTWSNDGYSWSDVCDDVPTGSFVVNGGSSLYFYVSPYYTGRKGTYLLDVSMTRTAGVAVDEKLEDKLIKVYPNPSQGRLIVDCTESNFNPEIVEVMDLSGKIVYQTTMNTQRMELDLSHLTSGMYQVKISNTDSYVVKKIVKND